MEKKDLEQGTTKGISLGTYQIHIDNIFDGGVIRGIHGAAVQDLVGKIRCVGWQIDSVSFYLHIIVRSSELNCVTKLAWNYSPSTWIQKGQTRSKGQILCLNFVSE
jgi:hypothetical protein